MTEHVTANNRWRISTRNGAPSGKAFSTLAYTPNHTFVTAPPSGNWKLGSGVCYAGCNNAVNDFLSTLLAEKHLHVSSTTHFLPLDTLPACTTPTIITLLVRIIILHSLYTCIRMDPLYRVSSTQIRSENPCFLSHMRELPHLR